MIKRHQGQAGAGEQAERGLGVEHAAAAGVGAGDAVARERVAHRFGLVVAGADLVSPELAALLAVPLDASKAEAQIKDGILNLYLPKADAARPKSIKIVRK